MSDSPVSPVSSAFAPASSRMKKDQSDSLDADKVADMMNEFQVTIRALEEKLDASGMENDLLQQRLAEIVNERTGNSPAPSLKFANPSNFDTSANNFDTSAKNFDTSARSALPLPSEHNVVPIERRGFWNSPYDIMISLDPLTHPPTSPINSPFVLVVNLLTHDQRVQGSIPTASQPVSTFFPVGPTGKKSGVLGGGLLWTPPPTHPPPSVMAC